MKITTKRTPKPRVSTAKKKDDPLAEKVNGVSVYTAAYKVNRSDELLEFLLRKCNTSRNNVKSLLVRKQVLVNGKVVTQYNYVLAKDDEVKLARKPVKDGVIATQNTVKTAKNAKKQPPRPRLTIKIIYEDEDFLVVDKPAGLLSVENDKDHECAYSYAVDYLQEKDKTARPFVLHRIDKETSGVLIFAKNVKIHSMLRMHWNEQVQTREYFAVVEGVPENRSGTITSYLKENANNLVYSTSDPSGQKAITHYEVLSDNGDYALLRVKIDTGRKNQIRVHMRSIGHAVVGDEKYGSEKNPLERLGLHASKLEFIHPVTKELLTFTSPLPRPFAVYAADIKEYVMKKIASFTVNHDTLEKGMYISRIDGDVVTYDIRMKKPNAGDYLCMSAAHTLEHLFATYARNSDVGEQVVYVGPMGCRTGFYLLVRDKLTHKKAIGLVKESMAFARDFVGEIPGNKKEECGNYLDHDLQGAKAIAKEMSEILQNWTEQDLQYKE